MRKSEKMSERTELSAKVCIQEKQPPEVFSKQRQTSQISQGTPVLESLFNEVASLQACNFVKKRLQHRCFPVKFAKFLITFISKNICERLLLIEITNQMIRLIYGVCNKYVQISQ